MEDAAAAAVSVCAADRRPGPAGAGGALLAPEQQERAPGEGRSSHGGLLPPVLQRRWRGRAGALVCHQGVAEQVKTVFNAF